MGQVAKPACEPGRFGNLPHALIRRRIASPPTSADNTLFLQLGMEPTRELMSPRGHRAIGVVYHPEYESQGNYIPTVLPRRCDAFLYLGETEALHLLRVRVDDEGARGVPAGGVGR